ncbi:MAG: response regulator, partial [Candidatus Sericytochromatia bacterium]
MTNSKHTILIIEDNLLNLRMLSLRLEKRNFNIIEQADGNSVILLLEQFLPDLILMDMNLPGISGLD